MPSSLLTITFWFSTLKFNKLQILCLIWQSILKNFFQKAVRQKWSFCPPSKGVKRPSWPDHKSKSKNFIRLKICICTLTLRSMTGKNFRKIWDGELHGLDDLTWNYLVTPCLVVTVQSCMEWIPIKKPAAKY